MKKAFVTLAAMMAFALASFAQTTLRQNINQPIHSLNIAGKSNVTVIPDNTNFIDVVVPDANNTLQPGTITIEGDKLSIKDQNTDYQYLLHLNANDLALYTFGDNAQVQFKQSDFPMAAVSDEVEIWYDGHTEYRVHNGDTIITPASKSFGNFSQPFHQFQGLVDQMQSFVDEMNEDTRQSFDSLSNIYQELNRNYRLLDDKKEKTYYDFDDRTDFDFLWGFTNWGNTPLNGLMKMPGAYNLKTSFSSYQLAWNYSVIMTRHWSGKVGVGYESDVYKFTNDYVAFTNNGTTSLEVIPSADRPFSEGNWSTKMVTRYVTLPISINYRSNDKGSRFNIGVGVVPGLCFNGKHTGLKHTMKQQGTDFKRTDDISSLLNPYKCDLRFDIGFGGTQLFVQVPLMPVFIDENLPEVYPIKIGFMI